MKRNDVDRSKLSPMMKHYVELKDKYEDVIILYRLGDFYEMFFEDAEVVAHALELTLTGKSAGLEEKVPMCGIPHHAAEIYIDKLIKKGFKVAICEQLEDPKNAKGIVKRDIIEVISSGTIINANSLNEKENNYIGSLYSFGYGYAFTYSDITTGDIYSSLYNSNSDIIYKLLSLEIKELIVDSNVDKELISSIRSQKIPVTIEDSFLTDNYNDISTKLRELTEAGTAVAITTQCMYEGIDLSVYEVGQTLAKQGIINCADMTFEASVMKLMCALAEFDNIKDIKAFMEKPYFYDKSY